ncbi:MAG: OmpA family protein [Pseudomonadota bacterium]
MKFRAALACFVFLLVTPAAAQTLQTEMRKDAAGARDAVLIGRFEGSFILGQQVKKFDELNIPLSPEKNGKPENNVTPQGRVTRTLYVAPEERSTLEITKLYQDALTSQGFEIVFQCSKDECGDDFKDMMYGSKERKIINAAYGQKPAPRPSLVDGALEYVRDIRYLAAKKTGDSDDTWVTIYAAVQTGGSNGDTSTALTGSTQALIEIVEPKASDAKLVTLGAEEIKSSLDKTGRVAFYGVTFDFDKATIKPESEPQLAEMAKFLIANADVKAYVTGHTDNKGTLDYNIKLSGDRAAAVMNALVKTYKIDSKRLTARGLASLAPVASNASEEGQAKNRRVELVEQ